MPFGTPVITNVEQVVDTNPDLYIRRAEQALREGDIKRAIAECDIAINYSNGGSHYYFEKAKIYNHIGSYSSCIQLIDHHLHKFKNTMNIEKLGEVYLYLFDSYSNRKYVKRQYFVASHTLKGNGLKNGFGVYFYPNGDTYVGEWENYKRNGYGALFTDADQEYYGRWENDRKYNVVRIIIKRTSKLVLAAGLLYGSFHYYDDVKSWFIDQTAMLSDETSGESDSYDDWAENEDHYFTVIAEMANIREFPQLDSAIITKAVFNERLLFLNEEQIDSEGRNWYFVRTENGDEGWISSKIVQDLYGSGPQYLDDDGESEVAVVTDEDTNEEEVYTDNEWELEEADPYQIVSVGTGNSNGYLEYEEIHYVNGAVYKGETVDGVPNGHGFVTWPNGTSYEGEFEDRYFHGYGTLSYSDGSVYSGNFHYDQKDGQGTLTWPDGSVYEGDFQSDERTGNGKFTWPDGSSYEGDFVNGLRHGHGTFSGSNGSYFVGEFVNDEKVE